MAELRDMSRWFGMSSYKLYLLLNENDQNEKLITEVFELSKKYLHPGRSSLWFNERLIDLNWKTPNRAILDGQSGWVLSVLRSKPLL